MLSVLIPISSVLTFRSLLSALSTSSITIIPLLSLLIELVCLWGIWFLKKWAVYMFLAWEILTFIVVITLTIKAGPISLVGDTVVLEVIFFFMFMSIWLYAIARKWNLFD